MFKLNLIEGIKNIDKNKFLTYLSFILFTFLFLLQGYTYSYFSVTEMQKEFTRHESIIDYELYSLNSRMPAPYVLNMNPLLKNDLEKETIEFFKELDEIENLKYITYFYGEVYVYDFKGDIETFGKEQVSTMDSNVSGVSALYCTPTFHIAEDYRVIKGRDFTDEDMVYNSEQPRAVLLGYKYKDVYEIGDIFTITENTRHFGSAVTQFEVIGILEEDTTIRGGSGSVIYDLDNCIVLPTIFMTYEDYMLQNKEVQKVTQNANYTYFSELKFMVDSGNKDTVLTEIQSALDNYSGFSKHFYIFNSKQIIEKIHSRTEAVTQFAFNITAVLMVASLVTIVFSVINRIENNLKDYAIHISLGSSVNGIVGFVIAEMAIILGCSTVLGLTVTKLFLAYLYMPYNFGVFLGIFAVTSLLVILLSAITARLTLKKYDLCTLIK